MNELEYIRHKKINMLESMLRDNTEGYKGTSCPEGIVGCDDSTNAWSGLWCILYNEKFRKMLGNKSCSKVSVELQHKIITTELNRLKKIDRDES